VSMAVIITSGHKNFHYRNPMLPISKFLGTLERRIRRIWVTFCTVKCVGSGAQPLDKYRELCGAEYAVIMKSVVFCKGIDVTTHCKLGKLEGPGHICRMGGSRTSGNILEGKYVVFDQ